MNVMHLISGGDVGGAKTHVLTLLQELGKKHNAYLVCFVDGPFAQEAREMGIPTRVLHHKNAIGQCKELLACISKWNIALLHCHGSKANTFACLIRSRCQIPLISTVHSDPRLDYLGRPAANATLGLINRWALRQQDGWVAVSDAMKELLISRGYDGDSIWPIYNGVVFPETIPHLPRQEFLQNLGLPWDERHVIFGIAARISAVKDLPTLVRAFAIAVQQVPNARLLIAGDGEQREQLETLVSQLCPVGTVHFAGWMQDMGSFYHALDVNMLSSISETFPYAITEGARMYCATISTAVGGVPKLVKDGQTGFLVEPGDHETMARRMVQLVEAPALRRTLGRKLHDKVRSEFSVESMARRQVEIYHSILARYHRRKSGRYGAVICGAYGKGNLGDDTILAEIIAQLRSSDANLPICVLTRKPRETSAKTGVSSVYLFRIPKIGQWMRRSQLYISGGGSLIQNVTSTRSLLYYLSSMRQAKKNGCKVMMYGCGIGPVSGQKNQKHSGAVISQCADEIALRDQDSCQLLAEFGVEPQRIHRTADPALLSQADLDGARWYLEKLGLESQARYAIFVLRPWENAQQKLQSICACADRLWQEKGLRPLLLSMEPNRDDAITAQALEKMQAPAVLLPPIPNGQVLCGLMRQTELVVSMRLHALVFACSQYTRVVGISYDPKVSGFLRDLDSDTWLELKDMTTESLWQTMERALNQTVNRTAIDALKSKAQDNAALAQALLQS